MRANLYKVIKILIKVKKLKANMPIGTILFLILFALLIISSSFAIDEEVLGRQAEQAGKLSQALKHYVAALQSVSDGSAEDQKLRKKIIGLALKVHPPPVIPEEALRYMARGRAAVKTAQNEQGFQSAGDEFKKALRIAPWLAESYYNLGIVLDKAGRYDEASKNLKLYLLAAPNSSDARQVQDFLYEIEYRKENEQKKIGFVKNLKGRWAAVSKSKKYTQYWIYNVSMKGANSLVIEFARRVEFDPPPSWLSSGYTGSSNRAVIEVTLKDLKVEGTLTSWLVDDGVGKINPESLIPKKYPVSGEVSKDGSRITLKSTQAIPAMTYKSGDYCITVLQKRY